MTLQRTLRRLVLVLAAMAGLVPAEAALAEAGTLVVTVTKPDGAPADYVDVSLESQSGTHQAVDLTDDKGVIRFPGIPSGTYTVFVSAEGRVFEKIVDLTVAPGETKTIAIREQKTETVQEEVVVIGGTLDILDIRATDNSSSVQGEFLRKIPLQNTNIQDFAFVFPGVTRVGGSDSTDISIAGGSGTQIGFRLNGISINDPVSGGAVLDVPAASIESFTLITGGFGAQYGEQSTGIAEIVTRSGTDELSFDYQLDWKHSEYTFQEIPELDTINTFVDRILRGAGTTLASDIETGMRLIGVDPISTTDDDQNPVFRRRIRQSISSGGPIVPGKVWFHTTLESLADDFGSAFVEGELDNDQLLWTSKLNWNLWQSGEQTNTLEVTASVDNDENSGAAFATASPSVATKATASVWTVAATDTHVFNPTTFLETKFSVQHYTTKSRSEDERTGVGTQIRVPLPPGGFFAWTAGAVAQSFDTTTDVMRLETSLDKTLGKHQLRTGVLYQDTSFSSFDERGVTLTDFRVADDRGALPGQQPSQFAGRATRSGPPTRTTNNAWQAAVYLQDTWSVTDNLTLDFGLRGDYQGFVGELFLAPRMGFSLDPVGDKKTRFYGNWGIFYDVLLAQALEHEQRPTRFTDDLNFAPTYLDRRFSEISIEDIFKEALTTPFGATSRDAVAFFVPFLGFEDHFVLDPNVTAPTNKDWSIGVERELPGKIRMQVSYRNSEKTHQVTQDVKTTRIAQSLNERTQRDIIFETKGTGEYRHWSVEFQRPVGKDWEVNVSYVQAKNLGPIAPPANPLDPNDVFYLFGPQGNDRTHVAKFQGRGKLMPKSANLDMSADFTWQTGLPASAEIITSQGNLILPLGRNTLRLPSTRQLNLGMSRQWSTQDDKLRVTGRVNFSNLLNTLNVTGALGRFATPEGIADPQAYPPLRPDILVTDIDVPRSAEFSIGVSF